MNKNRYKVLWFVLGLGSHLQLVASLSITECVVLLSAPWLFVRHSRELKRDGVMGLFSLAVLVVCGCILSCFLNHTPGMFALRGLAVTTIIACSVVFSHWLIRRSPYGFKWMLFGAALSLVLCTFVFQKSVEVNLYGGGYSDAESIAQGTLFWVQRLGSFVTLPTKGWYLYTPIWLDVPALMFMAVFAVTTTSSGRAASLASLGSVAILIVGGKKPQTMKRLSRYFWSLVGCAVVGILLINVAYRVAATNGWLGEAQRSKYERQAQGSKSIMKLLMAGRAESFIGLLACRDKPIFGWGPWAEDRHGYRGEFIMKYGSEEDIETAIRVQEYNAKMGFSTFGLIPGHSHITMFWLWYGIFGLVFWCYVLFVLVRFLRQDAWVVPQWYAWLASAVPGMIWSIFFNPVSSRVGTPLMIVACLMARALRKGTWHLPVDMQREIIRKGR